MGAGDTMMIQKLFHTYKDSFPLQLTSQNCMSLNGDAFDELIAGLILELSDLAATLPLSYISRHGSDKISQERLAPFLRKFSSFVDSLGRDEPYNIPTIWLVCHFNDNESAAEFQERIDAADIKYFDECHEYDSYEEINELYWDNKQDAEPFVGFLHQTTMIGIDLIKTADYKQKLTALQHLEYMRYASMEDAQSDLKEMERYLGESSQYYVEHISADKHGYRAFWENFTKWKRTEVVNENERRYKYGSWPHFLFNICGIIDPSELPPLKVDTAELFMYRRFVKPLPPESIASVSRDGKIMDGPPNVGDTVTFKAGDHVRFGLLVERIESTTIKGEIIILGGFHAVGGKYDGFKGWELNDKIEIDIDKLNGTIRVTQ